MVRKLLIKIKCLFGCHRWYEVSDVMEFEFYRHCLHCGKRQRMYLGDWLCDKDIDKKFKV